MFFSLAHEFALVEETADYFGGSRYFVKSGFSSPRCEEWLFWATFSYYGYWAVIDFILDFLDYVGSLVFLDRLHIFKYLVSP